MHKTTLIVIALLSMLGLTLGIFAPTALAAGIDFKTESACQKTETTDCIPEATDPAVNQNCTKSDCDLVGKYLNPFIKFLGIGLGLAATIGIAIGGVEYSSSGGDPQKAAKGKNHIVMAIIALVGYLFLYAGLTFLNAGGF